MPSRINIGPGGGPFVELDEENGEFVIRVPEDEVNFDQSDLRNVKDFTAGSVNTEQIGTERHYAGAYDGSGPDARLDSATSAASNGDLIYLENAEYSDNRTFDSPVTLVGTSSGFRGTSLGSTTTWTLNDYGSITNVSEGGEIVLTTITSSVSSCTGPTVTIQANQCRVVDCSGVGVTFESDTSGGVADSLANSSVTDNGANTVGDIA